MDPQTALLAAPLVVGQMLVGLGLALATTLRMARDPRVGPTIHAVRDSRGVKPVLFAVETGLLLVSLTADPFPTTHAILVLLGALALTAICPGVHDQACGELGVYRGWFGRRYEELDEWRLAGDHLRFRMMGEWMSVALPRDRQAKVRAILERVAPDRESPHEA